jgi:hypothetical protein
MRSEANKRIRQRKRIKPSYIARALQMRRPKGSDVAAMEWALEASGKPVPLVAYPHRQTRPGVGVEVNRGKRTLVNGAFATAAAYSGRMHVSIAAPFTVREPIRCPRSSNNATITIV